MRKCEKNHTLIYVYTVTENINAKWFNPFLPNVSFESSWEHSEEVALHEKCPNTELCLVRILLYSVRIQENTDQE